MLKKIIVKFKDGDIYMHNSKGNNEFDLAVLNSMICNKNIDEDYEEDDRKESLIHSIEIILA